MQHLRTGRIIGSTYTIEMKQNGLITAMINNETRVCGTWTEAERWIERKVEEVKYNEAIRSNRG